MLRALKSYINIGNHRQNLLYEGVNILCTSFGHLGHTLQTCSMPTQTTATPTTAKPSTTTTTEKEWKMVAFPKKLNIMHNQRLSKSTTSTSLMEQLQAGELLGTLLNPRGPILGSTNRLSDGLTNHTKRLKSFCHSS